MLECSRAFLRQFSQHRFGIFLSGEEGNASQSLAFGSMRLLYIALPYFLCGLMDVLTGLLRGMGSSTLPMIITVGGVCGLRIFWIYTVFAAYHELFVLYLSYPISWIVTGAIQFVLFLIVEKKLRSSERTACKTGRFA